MFLDDSRFKVVIATSSSDSMVQMDSYDLAYDDGLWHSVSLVFLEDDAVNLTIDNEILVRKLAFALKLDEIFYLGGGVHSEEIPGFIGCLKHVDVLGVPITLDSTANDGISQKGEEVVRHVCTLDDKCWPNPCQHGGMCKQNSTDFHCECEGTGYAGALCHTSLHYRSCLDFSLNNPSTK